jgi:hypothetical protein
MGKNMCLCFMMWYSRRTSYVIKFSNKLKIMSEAVHCYWKGIKQVEDHVKCCTLLLKRDKNKLKIMPEAVHCYWKGIKQVAMVFWDKQIAKYFFFFIVCLYYCIGGTDYSFLNKENPKKK